METQANDNRIVIHGYATAAAMDELALQLLIDGVRTSKDGPRCATVDDVLALAAQAEAEGRPLELHADSPHVPFSGAEGVLKGYGIEFQIVRPFRANGSEFQVRHFDGTKETYRRTPVQGGETFSAEARCPAP